ncbi:MAG: nickel-dependent hydrogenase large subunit [Bacteroidales bacterium]|nr:nickel-dependent hydrogenase large subunit [Bacteroidales bacterium]
MTQITIDPLTRIEGHLKVDINVDNNVVTDAQASGTMARGIEKLLIGRDPRDATYVTERICGVCFTVHGLTSSMAVEKAQGTTQVPEGARLIRNLIAGGEYLHDHPLHFYHLSAVDFLDIKVLKDYTGSNPHINKIKKLVTAEINNSPVEGQYAGPFVPTYQPDEYSIRNVDKVASLIENYLKALEIQAKAKKMTALFGGKEPHQAAFVPGGVTRFPETSVREQFKELLDEVTTFIREVYVPDVINLGTNELYGLATSDMGVGYQNYLAYGAFEDSSGSLLFPTGAIINGNLITTNRSDIESDINEDVTNAWYESSSSGHPSVTEQNFNLDKTAYSFVKSPRYKGQPMEVGPMARLMVAAKRTDHPCHNHTAVQQFVSLLDAGVKPGIVARHAARALETLIICDEMYNWLDEINASPNSLNSQIHDTNHWSPPYSGQGFAMYEAPRGALGHWISINDHKISHYACVVPTTWNASPMDANGFRGPYEEALMGTPVVDQKNPINVGRVIRSFDPCLACAVHVIEPNGNMNQFTV